MIRRDTIIFDNDTIEVPSVQSVDSYLDKRLYTGLILPLQQFLSNLMFHLMYSYYIFRFLFV